jgi:hypothetical protein
MAGFGDVKILTLPLGAFNGATELPLAKMASGYGGVTVLEAQLLGPSAGTVIGGILVTMTNAGTPAVNGTIGAFAGTVVTAAGIPGELTISDAYVADDEWIGFDQASGTVPAGTFISLSYIMGKSGS